MSYLCIDAATIVGWAISPGHHHGIKDLTPSKNLAPGVRYQRLWALLEHALFLDDGIDTVIYEEPIPHHSSMTAAEYAWGYVSIIKMWCAVREMKVRGVHVSTWKKAVTGHGNATKDDVMEAVRFMKFNPVDHNNADALGLMIWATGTGKLL